MATGAENLPPFPETGIAAVEVGTVLVLMGTIAEWKKVMDGSPFFRAVRDVKPSPVDFTR
jgi:hypothetical protein